MKKILLTLLLLCPLIACGQEGGPPLDAAPDLSNNMAALQTGAKLFVNYCLTCHSAQSMRYNRLHDIGLTDAEIKANLLFTTDAVGDTMKVAMRPADAKIWFGAAPPDLSVIARAKSPAYIYTYLRTYYRDPSRPTGWNNLAYPNTAMPHILWELQGTQDLNYVQKPSAEEGGQPEKVPSGFTLVKAGTMTPQEYDEAVADLTAFMDYMSEPARSTRHAIGVWVLLFLGIFIVITWRLNASFWKNIR